MDTLGKISAACGSPGSSDPKPIAHAASVIPARPTFTTHWPLAFAAQLSNGFSKPVSKWVATERRGYSVCGGRVRISPPCCLKVWMANASCSLVTARARAPRRLVLGARFHLVLFLFMIHPSWINERYTDAIYTLLYDIFGVTMQPFSKFRQQAPFPDSFDRPQAVRFRVTRRGAGR